MARDNYGYVSIDNSVHSLYYFISLRMQWCLLIFITSRILHWFKISSLSRVYFGQDSKRKVQSLASASVEMMVNWFKRVHDLIHLESIYFFSLLVSGMVQRCQLVSSGTVLGCRCGPILAHQTAYLRQQPGTLYLISIIPFESSVRVIKTLLYC